MSLCDWHGRLLYVRQQDGASWGTVPGWMHEGGLSPDSSLAGGRAVYDIVVRPPSGLQFHDVAVVATDAIADDIRRVMGILGRR